ncbi:TATA-box-binding protein [Natrarchaeobaculum sulfurireducens]|uniref:hypothetical protein n=1 Tax=Natrarchaeobaculum sulfurireducens TaxID=2044521 RepID=UPI000E3C9E77|nr:hypothetical protein [Natrarchaeobaculum sulfurireducens]
MGTDVDLVDEKVTRGDLEREGIEVCNMTATFTIDGEFDRSALAADLPNSEFNPDKHRSLIYRSSQVDGLVVLLPPSGRVSMVGVDTIDEMFAGVDDFINQLSKLGVKRKHGDLRIENIVATTDLGRSFDLSEVALCLGFKSTEYDPELFSGVIYRCENNTVSLIYSSGKVVINRSDTYKKTLECYRILQSEI